MSNRNRNYAIVGTGALGGFYGAKLQKAGFELFLFRQLPHRIEAFCASHGRRGLAGG